VLFLVLFGDYSDNAVGLRLRRAYREGLRVRELRITDEVPADLIEAGTPIRLTGSELRRFRGWRDGDGVFVGDPSNADDLRQFWNLRATGRDVTFLPEADPARVRAYPAAHLEHVPPQEHDFFAEVWLSRTWRRGEQLPETLAGLVPDPRQRSLESVALHVMLSNVGARSLSMSDSSRPQHQGNRRRSCGAYTFRWVDSGLFPASCARYRRWLCGLLGLRLGVPERKNMKALFAAAVTAAMLGVGVVAAVAAPTATIEFSLNPATCELTIISSKDISNFAVNGVKTEGIPSGTTSITIPVAEGDVITVKSGTTTATFRVLVGACHDAHDGEPHDPHDGHAGHDHDRDGDHDAADHHH
jgi:hypothetical protein